MAPSLEISEPSPAAPEPKEQAPLAVESSKLSEFSIQISESVVEAAESAKTQFQLEDHPIDSDRSIRVSMHLSPSQFIQA